MKLRSVLCVLLFLLAPPALAQETDTQIEQEREKALTNLGVSEIPNPEAVRKAAERIFTKPLEQQSKAELTSLTQQANVMANLIGFIHEEYDDYHRTNFRYEFVQKAVSPTLDQYTKISNEFKDYRNRAYFNLGLLAKANGETVESFLFFRDAFRLSSFDCGKGGTKNCLRWKAEQEMQKLLALSQIKAYVSWQR